MVAQDNGPLAEFTPQQEGFFPADAKDQETALWVPARIQRYALAFKERVAPSLNDFPKLLMTAKIIRMSKRTGVRVEGRNERPIFHVQRHKECIKNLVLLSNTNIHLSSRQLGAVPRGKVSGKEFFKAACHYRIQIQYVPASLR